MVAVFLEKLSEASETEEGNKNLCFEETEDTLPLLHLVSLEIQQKIDNSNSEISSLGMILWQYSLKYNQ